MFDLPDVWLRSLSLEATPLSKTGFPYDLPFARAGLNLQLDSPIIFFAGENGAGKSTLLETIALACDLPTMGANDTNEDPSIKSLHPLSHALRLGWRRRTRQGFFFRAEDFFGFQHRLTDLKCDLLDQIAGYESELGDNAEADKGIRRAIGYIRGQIHALDAHYGEDPDARSHGEAFLSAFRARIAAPGLYLLDEPEAALSPLRQMAFLKLMKDAVEAGSQFIIATHSPLLLRTDGAHIFDFDTIPLQRCAWEDLSSVRLWRAFWASPNSFLRHI